MKKIVIVIKNDEDFDDALAEITSNLDYDNIEYEVEVC